MLEQLVGPTLVEGHDDDCVQDGHERFLNKGSGAEGSCPSQPDNDSGD